MGRVKWALLFFLFGLIIGCGHNPVRTEVQVVERAVLYVPPPEIEDPPELAINFEDMSQEEFEQKFQQDGEIAVRVIASMKQLQEYAKRMRKQLKEYDQMSESFEQLREEFREQAEEAGVEVIESEQFE